MVSQIHMLSLKTIHALIPPVETHCKSILLEQINLMPPGKGTTAAEEQWPPGWLSQASGKLQLFPACSGITLSLRQAQSLNVWMRRDHLKAAQNSPGSPEESARRLLDRRQAWGSPSSAQPQSATPAEGHSKGPSVTQKAQPVVKAHQADPQLQNTCGSSAASHWLCLVHTRAAEQIPGSSLCSLVHTFGSSVCPWQSGHPDITPLVSELLRVDPVPHGYMDYNKLQLDTSLVSILLTQPIPHLPPAAFPRRIMPLTGESE